MVEKNKNASDSEVLRIIVADIEFPKIDCWILRAQTIPANTPGYG